MRISWGGLWFQNEMLWLIPWPLLSDCVRLVVRKVQFAPLEPGPGPWAQTIRRFLLSAQPLQLQAWMDREVGEPHFLPSTPEPL
jgi:hypothetical protein